MTDAQIGGASFSDTTLRGFTAAQLYSTASYKAKDLRGIDLSKNTLNNWDFAGQNLAEADLTGAALAFATLLAANLTDSQVRGAVFSFTTSRGFTAAQLYSTASYKAKDLRGIDLSNNHLSRWDFTGQNLTDADFEESTLTGADLTNALVRGARFYAGANYLSRVQLYSTASYKAKDLRGISFLGLLRRWNFAGQNLANASFSPGSGSTLTDSDLSFSDLRAAEISTSQLAYAATTEGAILPDGRIEGLALDAGERVVVRDYNGMTAIPITVQTGMSLDPAAGLRMVFEDDDWGSTISFEPGIPVSLGGSLELCFADDTNPAELIGTTFHLFDWEDVVVSGQFQRIVPEPGTVWDTSRFYTSGEVTLVPEPSALVLLSIAAVVLLLEWCLACSASRKRTHR